MKIILLSKQNFIKKELEKSTSFDVVTIKNIDDIYDLVVDDEKLIILHDLDSYDKIYEIKTLIEEEFDDVKIIALRNRPNNIEGCNLLKENYKAYVNSMSSIKLFEDVINSILDNNIWVYPELMNFIISAIPKIDNKNKKFDAITIKELEVLKLVAEGLTNNQIANILNIAEVTVKKHISSLLKKMDAKDRLSLALKYNN